MILGNLTRTKWAWKLTKNNKYTIDFVLASNAIKIQIRTAQNNIAGIQNNNAQMKTAVQIAILIAWALGVVE